MSSFFFKENLVLTKSSTVSLLFFYLLLDIFFKKLPLKYVFSVEVTRLVKNASDQVMYPCHHHHQGTALVVVQYLTSDDDTVYVESWYERSEHLHTL